LEPESCHHVTTRGTDPGRPPAATGADIDPGRGTGVDWHLPGNPRNPPAKQSRAVQKT